MCRFVGCSLPHRDACMDQREHKPTVLTYSGLSWVPDDPMEVEASLVDLRSVGDCPDHVLTCGL